MGRMALSPWDTRRGDSIAGMAVRLLEDAPSTFVLVGVSMGGDVALEVVRRAPGRVAGLALLSTSARPDSTEQLASRACQSDLVTMPKGRQPRSRMPR